MSLHDIDDEVALCSSNVIGIINGTDDHQDGSFVCPVDFKKKHNEQTEPWVPLSLADRCKKKSQKHRMSKTSVIKDAVPPTAASIKVFDGVRDATIVSLPAADKRDSMGPPVSEADKISAGAGPMENLTSRAARYEELYYMIQYLLEDMSKKKYCFDEMDGICRIGTELWMSYDNCFKVSIDTFKLAADRFQQTSQEVDIRILTHYLKAFRIIFLFVEDYNAAMRYVYSLKFKLDNSDVTLPVFHRFYEGFDNHLDGVLRQITNTDRLDDDLIREFACMLLITPRHVLRIIVMAFVHKLPSYDTLNIVRTLRHIPAFCELRFGLSNCEGIGRSILTALVYHFFIVYGRGDHTTVDFGNEEQRTRLSSVLQLFTTTRVLISDGTAVCLPIFDPNDLLADFAFQQFHPSASRNSINLQFALELIFKMLPARRTHQGVMSFVDRCVIHWRGPVDPNPTIPSVHVGLFMRYLADVCMASNTNYAIKVNTLSLLNYLNVVVEELVLSTQSEDYRSLPNSVRLR